MAREERLNREVRLINNSKVTLNVADVAKVMRISKPQAAVDVDFLLQHGRLNTFKIRRGWNLDDMISKGHVKF